jgi:hypothetical protein
MPNIQLALKFGQADSYSAKVIEVIKGADMKAEADGTTFAGFKVKRYDLSDHQFVTVTVTATNDKELILMIPRPMIVTIITGQSDLDKRLYFGPAKV